MRAAPAPGAPSPASSHAPLSVSTREFRAGSRAGSLARSDSRFIRPFALQMMRAFVLALAASTAAAFVPASSATRRSVHVEAATDMEGISAPVG